MSLTAQFEAAFKARLTGSAALGTPVAPINLSGSLVFADGTGVNQANRLFTKSGSLAASAADDLDFAGSLTDPLGAAFTPAKVKGLFIKAGAANPGNLLLGGDANAVPFFSAANDVLIVPPGALLPLFFPGAGIVVTASTGDILQIAAAATAGTYTYELVALGTSV